MTQTKCAEDFEQALLSHVETCYSVALALTRDPQAAERITRTALAKAWRWRENWDERRSLRMDLLKLLRRTFIDERRVSQLCSALHDLFAGSVRVSEGCEVSVLRDGYSFAEDTETVATS